MDFIADSISGRMASNSSPHEGSISQFAVKKGKIVIALSCGHIQMKDEGYDGDKAAPD